MRSADPCVTLCRNRPAYMANRTPSRHSETAMLAIVSRLRRRLRMLFFIARGKYRNMGSPLTNSDSSRRRGRLSGGGGR